MSEFVPITPADRAPHRHGEDCFCKGGQVRVERFVEQGVEVDPRWIKQGLGAREAAALLSGKGLSSGFLYRGQGEACMWLLGFVEGREGPGA